MSVTSLFCPGVYSVTVGTEAPSVVSRPCLQRPSPLVVPFTFLCVRGELFLLSLGKEGL